MLHQPTCGQLRPGLSPHASRVAGVGRSLGCQCDAKALDGGSGAPCATSRPLNGSSGRGLAQHSGATSQHRPRPGSSIFRLSSSHLSFSIFARLIKIARNSWRKAQRRVGCLKCIALSTGHLFSHGGLGGLRWTQIASQALSRTLRGLRRRDFDFNSTRTSSTQTRTILQPRRELCPIAAPRSTNTLSGPVGNPPSLWLLSCCWLLSPVGPLTLCICRC